MNSISQIAGFKIEQTEQKKPANNYIEVTFVDTVAHALKQGKISAPSKAESGFISFQKNQGLNFNEVKWDDEEEKINAFIARIQQILEEKK
ncbi:hypothetical protein A2276_05640 [candidate division WOR-1 bacterium RIFOXYA12_FULL_43_27]|uniref:Uncharacterized protein n=1 Tax=candidate division WOR-1 bacterium RIFOXYC2_FULL_46_14 TaxID=1802587 RepID=A0A1F4U3K8_UNCSA|nr:MAG: hypothetical protein A2276_05640 [candidate division WOR-1 bacterium RIFOXYA12_FULL_43_27]OGC20148.1 MAG: hypothetical protein A2292_03645 [candidate division WOR-1 bacterium RIFOXYB2_FULL_46_45]OGC32115.1 MAG: hypothetical protein A2232_07805 [candidate division WOR-1 bacterium RIFOXYA2_FULL_46_56]OGC39516.1 MAG: hypothetical protein A2438_08170 [candidate division WOR-1 bacterium RIFOXYC2_FULL_46_14]